MEPRLKFHIAATSKAWCRPHIPLKGSVLSQHVFGSVGKTLLQLGFALRFQYLNPVSLLAYPGDSVGSRASWFECVMASAMGRRTAHNLWPPSPCITDADIIFLPYGFFFMAALCNRAGHYIFPVVSLSTFLSSPNLGGRRLDVYHTSTHGVALVRI